MRVTISGSPNCFSFVEHGAAAAGVNARRIRKVEHGVALGAEFHALVGGGQEAAAPKAVVERLVDTAAGAARNHHYESRQVVGFAAQTVADPRAEAGAPGHLAAGLNEGDNGVVIDGFGEGALHHAHLVGYLRGVGKQFAEPDAGFAVAREFVD